MVVGGEDGGVVGAVGAVVGGVAAAGLGLLGAVALGLVDRRARRRRRSADGDEGAIPHVAAGRPAE